MFTALKNVDQQLFLLINGAHNYLLDFVMWWVSNMLIWTPLYIWLIYLLARSYGKKIWWILLTVALLILSSDRLSVFLKNTVQRLRPSHEPALLGMVHSVNNYMGGTYGFVSSHAANTMALAVFLWLLLPDRARVARMVLIPYVIFTGYSRIYLGVHYPLDILGGWMVGILTACIAVKVLQYKIVPLKNN